MTVERRQVKLAKNAEAMERALSRLVRITNRIDQLRRERKRLVKPRPFQEQPEVAVGLNDELPEMNFKGTPADIGAAVPATAPTRKETRPPQEEGDGLDIPESLRRNRRLQTLPDPKTKEKKAERRVVEKQVRDAELSGKRRQMPKSGKAAIEHILGEAIYGKRDSR